MCDQVELLPGLKLLSQSSVSAMMCLVTASKSFGWHRTSPTGVCRKVSNHQKMRNSWLESVSAGRSVETAVGWGRVVSSSLRKLKLS